MATSAGPEWTVSAAARRASSCSSRARPHPRSNAPKRISATVWKRDEHRPPYDQRPVPRGQRRSRNELCAVDIGVDDGRASPSALSHERTASRKAWPSSGVRSSITSSSGGGSGRTRRRSSSTGSSRCSLLGVRTGSTDISTSMVPGAACAVTAPLPCPLRALFDRQPRSLSGHGGRWICSLSWAFSGFALVVDPANHALQAGRRGFESHQLHNPPVRAPDGVDEWSRSSDLGFRGSARGQSFGL